MFIKVSLIVIQKFSKSMKNIYVQNNLLLCLIFSTELMNQLGILKKEYKSWHDHVLKNIKALHQSTLLQYFKDQNMKGVKEMIAFFLHSLLHLSDHSAGSLNQSQFHEGISNLTPEKILSLYELTCGLAMPGFRSIDWEKVIWDFQGFRLSIQFIDHWSMIIAIPKFKCLISQLVKYLPITITSPVCINQH